jgi:tetratricopeptide (TPR) repeat protein
MEIPIEGAGPRSVVLAASLVIAAVLAFQASEVWLANHRINSQQLETIESGAYLMPGNGEAWDRVGRFEEYDFASTDPASAVMDFQRAIKDDPLSSYYWIDLGSAYELAGDAGHARHAYEQAKSVYPASAFVAWSYGNFLLRQGQDAEAYSEIQRSVRTDPLLLPLAISRVWRASGDVNQLLDQVLPPDTNAYFQAMDFFVSIHETEPGLVVWQRLISLKKPFALARSFPFLDELIQENRGDEAQLVWQGALAATGSKIAEPQNRSAVWDGNFTQDFPKGGLGWRWDSPLGVSIDFDSAPSSQSGRSVRLDFSGGANLELDEPSEFVPVDPGRTYHFHGEMRTEGITTESGMRFSLVDPHDPGAVNVTTENFVGSHAWTNVDADVKTGPNTHFLNVRLVRSQSRLFDNKLGGTVWIGNISLVPSDAGIQRDAQ